MSRFEIVNSMTRSFHKVGFKVKQHSPEILVGAGIVGTVTGAVMACKATTKISEIVDDTKEQLDIIHESAEAGEINTAEGIVEYTEDDMKKDTAIVYAQTGVKFIKLYGPSIAVGALGITSIIAGHRILSKRNIALAAAYATVEKGFKNYRSRVVERFGEELDRELKYNIKSKEFEEVTTDDKGKEKVVKKTVEVVDSADEFGDGAKFFDATCNGWCKDPELNLAFLKKVERFANDKLKAKGYLFLNEVYDMLGMQETRAGHVIGWVYDESNPDADNYVSFGIYNSNREANRRFVNGYEPVILLEFNHDGNIMNKVTFEGGVV